MHSSHRDSLFVRLAACALATGLTLSAGPRQASGAQGSPPRVTEMRTVLATMAPDRSATTADAERFLALADRAQAEGLPPGDRRTAVTELYREMWRFRGFDVEAGQAALNRSAATAAAMLGFGASFSLDGYAPPADGPEGRIHVVKRGRGPVPLVLVSDTMLPAEEMGCSVRR